MKLRQACAIALAGLLAAPPAWSGTPDTLGRQSNSAVPGAAEVRFLDGSIVMMTMLQDHIEIQTEYGKLTVPQKDIRQIEFGIRTSPDERQKYDEAFRRLASNVYKEREAAVSELVDLGPQAYFRLQSVTGVDDAEVTKRAQAAVLEIRAKYHPRMLRSQEDDVVRTSKFTIMGRITNPKIKAKAEEFGERELRPAKLLLIRWLGGESTKVISIDAAAYGNSGDRRWMDTGVQISPHMGLKVTAAGQVDLWPQQPGQYMTGPDGHNGGNGGGIMIVNGQPARLGTTGSGGELLGRIGQDGTPFVIGSRYTKTPKDSGKLYLQIVPSPWGNPSAGEYQVKIATGPFAMDSDREE